MKRIIVATCMVIVILAAVSVYAGPKKIEMPEYGKHTLDNGLTVFIMETREVPLVSLRLLVPVGSVQDPAGKEGIANLTGRLLAKGADGIAADEMPYIFEPFYRIEKSRSKHIKGYGLGLNLCKMIMEAQQGKIKVESSEGIGTTVELLFPSAGPV